MAAPSTEIQMPPGSVRTDTPEGCPHSMSFYHDTACTGSASYSRPRTGRDHHGAVSHGQQRLLSRSFRSLSTRHKKGVSVST